MNEVSADTRTEFFRLLKSHPKRDAAHSMLDAFSIANRLTELDDPYQARQLLDVAMRSILATEAITRLIGRIELFQFLGYISTILLAAIISQTSDLITFLGSDANRNILIISGLLGIHGTASSSSGTRIPPGRHIQEFFLHHNLSENSPTHRAVGRFTQALLGFKHITKDGNNQEFNVLNIYGAGLKKAESRMEQIASKKLHQNIF